VYFRIPNSEAFFSQPATDPGTIIIIFLWIGCLLTEKRLGTRNSEFEKKEPNFVP
jgi:hypothetical protein